jgi:6-phosphogluconolactonase
MDPSDAPHSESTFVYVGMASDEIAIYRMDPNTAELAPAGNVPTGRHPSFLAFSPSKKFVYVVYEFSYEVASFSVDARSGALAPLGRVPTEGVEPAYVSVDRTGRWVFASNYEAGPVLVYPVRGDGSLGPPSDARKAGVHPHAILVDPSNRFVFVPNLGSDTISQYRFDAALGKLIPNSPPDVSTEPRSEPRHLVFHPNGKFAYLIDEVGSRVEAYALDGAAGTLSRLGSMPTLPAGVDRAGNTGSDVRISPSGKFLYGSNRGHDSIVIYAVENDGTLSLVGHEKTRGKTPRVFNIDPTGSFLFAANLASRSIAVFRIDETRGTLIHLRTVPTSGDPYWVGAVTLAGGPKAAPSNTNGH